MWWVKTSNLFAYRFILNREAWGLFCDEMGVCGEHVVDGAPGDWIVELANVNMPTIAPNDEEMVEQMRDLLDHGIDASDLVTPALYAHCIGGMLQCRLFLSSFFQPIVAQPEETVVFFVNRSREDVIPLIISGGLVFHKRRAKQEIKN